MNNRRGLVIVLGTAAWTPRALFAQAKKQPVLIGWLGFGSRREEPLVALKEELAALGWKEGAQYVIDIRWAEGRDDRLAILARELAERKPALIVAWTLRAAVSAAKEAPKIPIVMAAINDPVAAGLVTNLARPGGMVTGLAGFSIDLSGKHVELLAAAAPKVKRVGFLSQSTSASLEEILEMARRSAVQYKVDARFSEVTRPEDIEPAIARLAKEGVQGLVILPFALLANERRRILALAAQHHWPVVAGTVDYVEEGALLSYGTDRASIASRRRRLAYYVDRILKGANPGDLPIEQPTTFELVVNMRTAKALGLTMPPEIMVRATRVIE